MLKAPLTYKQQIERLREHGLCISDTQVAEKYLRDVGYYTLSGYALSFRKSKHDSDFMPGTCFEQIVLCCEFDSELRSLLLEQLVWLEQLFRATVAYQFSEAHCLEAPHNQHYNLDNYKDQTRAEEILNSVGRHGDVCKGHAWYEHHRKKYGGQMPLWVLICLLSFSSLSKYYSCLLDSDQQNIARALNTVASILKNQLHCLSALRNRCAHGDRLFDQVLKPRIKLPEKLKWEYPYPRNNTLFAYILAIVMRITDPGRQERFVQSLKKLFNQYKNQVDLERIGVSQDYAEIVERCVRLANP